MIEEIGSFSENSDRIEVQDKKKIFLTVSFLIMEQNFWSFLVLNVPATAWVFEVMVLA